MKIKYVTVWLFLGVIGIFTALSVFSPGKSFSESENRYLAGKPDFTVKKLLDGSFGTDYETYLSDQFPLRASFVSAKTNMERLMFKTDVNGVYFGRDNYYIEKFDSEDLMTEQLQKNLDYLAKAADDLTERLGEARVRLMLVPSASQILTDKLPPFAAPANQEHITELLKGMLDNPQILLPVEESLKNRADAETYYKTDHHWTSEGAYAAYRLYAESLGLEPWAKKDFTIKTAATDFLGTIESKVKTGMQPDRITLYLPKQPQEYQVFYDGLPTAHPTLYSEKALSGKDKYAVFLDGNHGWTKIINHTLRAENTESAERRLMILKDSYAHSFAPFAVNHFGEVHMVDLRYFNKNLSEFMTEKKITDVLVLYQIPGFSNDSNLFKMSTLH